MDSGAPKGCQGRSGRFTSSTTSLSIASGNKAPATSHTSSPLPEQCLNLMRIACDSQSWISARSRSIHCGALVGKATELKRSRPWIEISRRFLCSDVMVLSVVVIHATANLRKQNETSSSLVALERSVPSGFQPLSRVDVSSGWTPVRCIRSSEGVTYDGPYP